jgi:stage VI sporulation protein D
LTQDRSSKLSFSIEESVWLNKGQEVDEIVSLSLDPEITVQEHGEYVLIRGGLRLTGEYRSSGNHLLSDGEHESLASQVAYRSIEEVTLNEDGTGEIRHHFPIDVTIPQERIRSLDDIYVIVDSFDYDLPERGCIQLTADVSITGMSAGKTNKEVVEEEVTHEEADRTFHFEAYNEEQVEQQVTSRAEVPEIIEESTNEISDEYQEEETVVQFPTEEVVARVDEEEVVEEVKVEEEFFSEVDEVETYEMSEEDPRIEEVEVEAEFSETVEVPVEDVAKENQSPAVAFGVVKDRPKTKAAEANEQPQAKEEGFSLAKSFTGERRQEVKRATQQQEEVQELQNKVEATESQEKQDEEVTTPREENALYLTKMLTKGEGEQFKKLKLCIIRENETLETIAARYEINQSTLIRVNRLNDAKVEEGQILYIPVTQ